MPDNNTLLAQLLQRPTNIGPVVPGHNTDLDPEALGEHQQPDPFKMVVNAIGDPVESASPMHVAAGPPGTEGKFYDLLRGGWTDYAKPTLTQGPAIDKFLETIRDYIRGPLETPAISEVGRTTSRKIPLQRDQFMKPPEGFKFTQPIKIERNPAVTDQLKLQQRITAKEDRAFNKLPLEEKIKQKGLLEPSKEAPTYFYRADWAGRAQPTPDIVRSMRNMAAAKLSLNDIKAKFPKMDEKTIQSILNKDTWAWVK